MWECTKINCFCGKILNIISKIIGKVIPLDPRLCILHICPLNLNINKHERLLLILCLLEAKRVIACSCKTEESPGVSQWIKGMTSCLALENIFFEKQTSYILVHLESVLLLFGESRW